MVSQTLKIQRWKVGHCNWIKHCYRQGNVLCRANMLKTSERRTIFGHKTATVRQDVSV